MWPQDMHWLWCDRVICSSNLEQWRWAAKYIEFTRLFVRLRITLLRHLGSLHTNQMQVDREFTGHSCWGWIAECLWQFSGRIVANWDSSLWWVLSWVNCGLYLLLLCQHHHWSIIILRAYMLDRHQFIDASCISKGPSWRGESSNDSFKGHIKMYFRTGICQERQVHIVIHDRENRIDKGCCCFNFHKN